MYKFVFEDSFIQVDAKNEQEVSITKQNTGRGAKGRRNVDAAPRPAYL